MSDLRTVSLHFGDVTSVTVRGLRKMLAQIADQDSVILFMGENTDEIKSADLLVMPFVNMAECKDAVIFLGSEATDSLRELATTIDSSKKNQSTIETTDGEPLNQKKESDRQDGQHKNYLVLNEAERKRGFVRKYRESYRHLKCGAITKMGQKIAETYARDPYFYNATFCIECKAHFPIGENGEFVWCEKDGSEGPKVGT